MGPFSWYLTIILIYSMEIPSKNKRTKNNNKKTPKTQ